MSEFARFCLAFCAWIVGFTILGWVGGFVPSDDRVVRTAVIFAAAYVGFSGLNSTTISTTKHTQGEG